jgi:hypothetical protein
MLIPYSTDAQIYHWPLATVGTIIVNALVLLLVAALPEEQQATLVPGASPGNVPFSWCRC